MSYPEIIERLDLIIKLLVKNLMKADESQKEKIIHLNKMGFKPKEIANILNTTSNSVSVALSTARKEGLL